MRQEPAPDVVIGQIATRQHGVVTLDQLRRSGVTPSGISRRVGAGRLHRIHRGVYSVGHRGLAQKGEWIAAVKACGDGAVLSHRSAGALWRITAQPDGPIDITIPGHGGRERRPGIRLHRSTTLLPSDCTLSEAIPVTKPVRTLEDLHRLLCPAQFAAALGQAEHLGLPIDDRFEPDLTRSELERRFLRLCRRHRIVVPEVNARVGAFLVDFLWRDEQLIVETNGYRFHRGPWAFESDRTRDVELRLLGYTVVRFTHRQVVDESTRTARTLRALLVQS
jgi:very-short-patch-repair endonuclease